MYHIPSLDTNQYDSVHNAYSASKPTQQLSSFVTVWLLPGQWGSPYAITGRRYAFRPNGVSTLGHNIAQLLTYRARYNVRTVACLPLGERRPIGARVVRGVGPESERSGVRG
jgi:hypothetical protein